MHPTYFETGDTAIVRHLADAPEMVVKTKLFVGDRYNPDTRVITPRDDKSKRVLERIVCFWFSADKQYQERDYDYKDLLVVKRARATANA